MSQEKMQRVDDILPPDKWGDLARDTGDFADTTAAREMRQRLGLATKGLQPTAWFEGPKHVEASDTSVVSTEFTSNREDELEDGVSTADEEETIG